MSEQALQPINTAVEPVITAKEVEEFILGSNLARTLTAAQRQICIRTALTWNLNPLKREIHFVAYAGQEPKIVIGYDVYIKRAERTKNLDGWSVKLEGEPANKHGWKAVITIHRKDWTHPFTHEVYYDEAVQTKANGEETATWKKMPRFMLKKVAIGQGFRLAFPEEMGGLPYMAEEVGLDEVTQADYRAREDGAHTHIATGEIVEQPSTVHTPVQERQRVAPTNPRCPVCGGEMWDNREGKKNPKAPDFKCKDRTCDGVIWPEKDFDPKEDVRSLTAEEEVKQMFPSANALRFDQDPDTASLYAMEGR